MSTMSELDLDARQRAADAVKRRFPTLVGGFADQYVDHLVDVVIDTYLEVIP